MRAGGLQGAANILLPISGELPKQGTAENGVCRAGGLQGAADIFLPISGELPKQGTAENGVCPPTDGWGGMPATRECFVDEVRSLLVGCSEGDSERALL